LLGTFLLTVIFDLTVAVEVGLLLACGFFIWRMSQLFRVEPAARADAPPGVQVMRLYGPMFFGAVAKVEGIAERLAAGTRCVVLEMHRMISLDTSGVDALRQLHRALQRRGVRLLLAELNEQPRDLILRSGLVSTLGEEHLFATLADALRYANQSPHAAAASPV
jgi:SulP family sulfate permease